MQSATNELSQEDYEEAYKYLYDIYGVEIETWDDEYLRARMLIWKGELNDKQRKV